MYYFDEELKTEVIRNKFIYRKKCRSNYCPKKGEVFETGNHQELVSNKSEYFNLVKNQLELGA